MTMELPILVYRQWNYLLRCSQMEIIIVCGMWIIISNIFLDLSNYLKILTMNNLKSSYHKIILTITTKTFLKNSSLSQHNEIKFSYYDKIFFGIWVSSI